MPDLPITAHEATELPIDELALRLLRFFAETDVDAYRARYGVGGVGLWQPDEDKERAVAASQRAVEAWDWLISHGLVALRPSATTISEPGYVTPRGQAVLADTDGLATIRAEDRLDVAMHPRLEHRIRRQFLMGEHELAAFAAMREVEIRVRELGGYPDNIVAVDLMRSAFNPNVDTLGPLADPAQVTSEREGTAHLFAGAMAVFKNPSSHREIDFDDPTVASEIVLLADLLLRMLDGVERRRLESGGSAAT